MDKQYIAALLIGLAGGSIPAWWITADHYQGVIAKEHVVQQQLVIDAQEQGRIALLEYIDRGKKAGVEYDKNTRILTDIRRERERLRIDFPPCSVPNLTNAGSDSDEAARVLPNPISALFERLQSRTGILVEEADTLNVDAIRKNTTDGVK